MKRNRQASKFLGRALILPQSYNTETREVDVVFATETPVFRFGWEEDYNEILVCDASAMRADRSDKGLPVLDTHNGYSLSAQIGKTVKVWFNDKREACATVRLSGRSSVEGIAQDISDGILTEISVGYRVFRYEKSAPADGEKFPIYRAMDWMPYEISFVPVPADINCGVRTAADKNNVEIITNTNFRAINKKRMEYFVVEEGGVKQGDEITIDDVIYIAQEDGEQGDTIQVEPKPEEGAEESAAEEEAESAANEDDRAADISNIRRQATAQERGRLNAILKSSRAAKLPDARAIELYQSGKPVAQCRQEILEDVVRNQQEINGSHSAGMGMDALEKKRGAIQQAILHRVYPSVFKLEKTGNEFRGMSLAEMGKEILKERGVSVAGKDKSQIAHLIFSRTHSSSDFPLLFEGAIDKMLRADYQFAEEFWDKIARQTTVTDFRAKNLYQVESLNGMSETQEGGEIKYTTLTEGKSFIRVKSYAEGIKFTRQAFINDDLNALSIIPSRFVKDWDELRGNLVWGLIVNNATMSDGKALFSADHNNLISGTTSALSEAGLSAALLKMKKQTGLDGKRIIRVVPKFLIVPPELEVTARKLLTAITASTTSDVNVFTNAFDIVVEPRLADASAWYLSADPNAIDSLYYAYLEGNEALRVNNEDDFSTDCVKYAVRGDFGAAAIDWRGLVKSAGQ
jgi:hypothetical protein